MVSSNGTKPTEPVRSVSDDVMQRFGQLGRELSTMIVLFHSRIAERMGLSGTDHKCLELALRAREPLTAGQIAQQSGLSTGAVTGVIDRLERRGFVHRVRDPHDRRKVLVEVSEFDEADFAHLFQDAVGITERVIARFDQTERDTIERYLRATIDEHARILEQD